jgi:single-stranded-DNA-specific exonuclease
MFKLFDPISEDLREELAAHDEYTASLLVRRGITNAKDAETFLAPSYDDHIGDPFLILNMEKAATRVAEAIASKERITVWSDYDCDGIPGGVLMHDFLKKTGANFTNYIPHRHLEGYGLNIHGIEKLAKEGTTLLITVDSGITDVEHVTRANELGMTVIVTDHHEPLVNEEDGTNILPPAFAVLDPKQKNETNGYRDFCGAGMAWKLCTAILKVGFPGRENIPVGWEKWLLDMAGLATIADIVPLTGENRVIAKYGLLVMRKSPRIGFQKLCSVARVNQRSITEEDVGFMIAPRINAASRMGNPRDAFELFTTEDENRADELSKDLEKLNRSRKALSGATTRSARARMEEKKAQGEIPAVIAMGDPDWRPGLLGIVASTLAEEYGRPVFLWGREGDSSNKGSCRTGSNVSLVDLMTAASDVFVGSGGHAQAGGFSVRDDALTTLEQRLCEALATLPVSKSNDRIMHADAEVTPGDILSERMKRTEVFAPFGLGNPKPIFLLQNMSIKAVSWFGKGEEHLKISLEKDDGFMKSSIEAISFFAARELGAAAKNLEGRETISLLGNLERDQFTRGQPIRIRIVAIS